MKNILLLTLVSLAVLANAQVANFTNVYIDPGLEVHMFESMTNNSTVNVGTAGLLYVDGTLVNNGTMTFENSSSLLRGSTGSDGTGSGNYIVKRLGSTTPGIYNFWSSPMTSHDLSAIGSTGRYYYNPGSGTYTAVDDTFDPGWILASGNMIQGKGYTAQNAGQVSFNGNVNNGNVTIPLQYFSNPNPALGGVPFNLVGNPFPSGLSVASFLAGNSSQISGAVYLWDDPGTIPYNSSDYATINAAGTVSNGNSTFNSGTWLGSIASGQGFKVEALPSASTLTFTNAMRTANNAQFYRAQGLMSRIWLKVEGEGLNNETLIAFIDDATDQRDHPYDARKLIGQPGLAIYTLLDDDSYAIQGFPPLVNLNRVVDIGTKYGSNGQYTISLKELDNFDPNIGIYLEDMQTGIWTNLRVDSFYTYTAATGIFPDRFNLHFLPPTITSIDDEKPVSANIFSDGTNLIVDFSNGTVEKAQVELYDMIGKHVIEPKEFRTSDNRIQVPLGNIATGNYIARVLQADQVYSRKLFIH